jgi:flagellar hook-basal body complex protein FliE
MKVDATMAVAAQATQAAQGANLSNATAGAMAPSGEAGGTEFAGKVKDMVGSMVDSGRSADSAVMDLMTGGESDMHTAMVKIQEADLGLRFVVQLRNRAVSAYEEIMRLQV